MTITSILAPAAALVLWTIVMLVWTALTRFPAMAKLGVDVKSLPPGGRGQNLEGVLPPEVQWKAHNYAHLVEQPTLFYAVVGILAIAGAATSVDVTLAWSYVVLRVAHSLWQSVVNTIPVRFALFGLSSVALTILGVRALVATL